MQKNRYLKSTIYLIAAQCMVSFTLVASKHLLLRFDPFVLLMFRFGVSSLILFVLHYAFSLMDNSHTTKYPLTIKNWFIVSVQSLCAGAIFNILFMKGLVLTGAATAGILSSALPVVVMIFSIVFLREKLTLSILCCVLFACVGIVMVNHRPGAITALGSQHISGSIWILLSLLPEASYYVLCKIYPIGIPSLLLSAIMNAVNFLFFVFLCIVYNEAIPKSIPAMDVLFMLLTSVTAAMFYFFWLKGCRHVSGVGVSISTAFMPMTTLLLAVLFLHEKIFIMQILGMTVIVAAALISMRRGKTSR